MDFLLGHSPDPDDAFMFYALAQHKIDTHGHRFEHILQDIETLNQRALRGELAYLGCLDPCLRLPGRQICVAPLWREHGRRLRSDAGDPWRVPNRPQRDERMASLDKESQYRD